MNNRHRGPGNSPVGNLSIHPDIETNRIANPRMVAERRRLDGGPGRGQQDSKGKWPATHGGLLVGDELREEYAVVLRTCPDSLRAVKRLVQPAAGRRWRHPKRGHHIRLAVPR